MSIAATQLSSTAFSVGLDLTGEFVPGLRVRADCGTDGTKLGSVATSSYSSATGLTTVTLVPDSGSLTANLASVLHGNDVPDSMPRATTDLFGAVRLATSSEAVTGTDAAKPMTAAVTRQASLSCFRDTCGLFPGLPATALNLYGGTVTADTAPSGTFSRSTTATRLGATGLVETVAAGSPRREWGEDNSLRGWRIEAAGTNLITYSEQFEDTSWTKVLTSVSANAAVAPDGTSTADKLIADTTSSNSHSAYHAATTVIGTTYTFAVYAKAAEYSCLRLALYDTSPTIVIFNLAAGTVDTGSGTLFALGNGWYRCAVSFTPTKTTAYARVYVLATNAVTTFAGDGTSGLYLWGAQVEASPYPTSYVPTASATVARSGDAWTIALATSWFNTAAGTIFLAGRTPAGAPASGAVQVLGQYDDGSASNRIRIARDENRVLRCIVTTAGTEVANCNLGTLADATTFRVAFAWTSSGFAASLSGGTVVTATAATLPTGLTTHRIGSDAAGASQWGGHVLHDAYFPVAFSATRLQAITL